MANLYEKFDKVDEAEEMYKKVAEQNPNDAKACGALAGFYNKPLWDETGAAARSSTRPSTILERCAQLAPNDPSGYQKVATFYWDKAYRDPLLTDEQKQRVRGQGPGGRGQGPAAQARLLRGRHLQGPALPREGQGHARPEAKQQYLDQAHDPAEAGPGAAEAGGSGRAAQPRRRRGAAAAPVEPAPSPARAPGRRRPSGRRRGLGTGAGGAFGAAPPARTTPPASVIIFSEMIPMRSTPAPLAMSMASTTLP